MSELDTYEILVREHEHMLQGFLLSMVRDPGLAEDLAQEAFIRAHRKLSTLRKKGSFASWLRTIARNLAIDEMKRRKREVPTDPKLLQGMEDVFGALDDPEMADTWSERVKTVKRCFEKLPDTLRKTCDMHYMKNTKARDIASKLSVTLSAVLKRLERGRSAVRQCVEKALGLEKI